MEAILLETPFIAREQGLSLEEEKLRRMTLLVGIVGLNGIVLAADRNGTETLIPKNGIDETFDSPKIVHLQQYGVVCAFAGDGVSQLVPEAIEHLIARPEAGFFYHVRDGLQNSADEAFRLFAKKTRAQPIRCDRQLFVALYGPNVNGSPQLWTLEFNSDHSRARQIEDGLELAGSKGNGAGFFRRYWKRDSPVGKMAELAAHIILAGHKWDSYIDGLDVVTITNDSKFHEFTGDEKCPIKERYEKWDRALTKRFS